MNITTIKLNKKVTTMFEEETTDLIGCFATLLKPIWGCSEATVVEIDGTELILRLRNKREVVVVRNDALIYQ